MEHVNCSAFLKYMKEFEKVLKLGRIVAIAGGRFAVKLWD